MLRYLFVISAFSLAAAAAYAADGDNCTADGFATTCTDATDLHFCSTQDDQGNPLAQPVEKTADCTFPDAANNNTPQVPGGTCDGLPCDGAGCFLIEGNTCLSGDGDPCIGLSPRLDNDGGANDNLAFAALCSGTDTCETTANGDTCVPRVGAACTVGGPVVACEGNKVVLCVGGDEDANGNGALDAGEDQNGNGTNDAFVIPSAFSLDCASLGGTCDEAATDGIIHAGFQVQAGAAVPDCALPAEGEGEGDVGEGEGEGDNADACQADSDCGRDRQCQNGTCVAADGGGENPPLCGNLGAAGTAQIAAFGLLLGVVPMIRRRRR